MQVDADSILRAALQLPENDRLALITRLMEATPETDPTNSVNDPDLVAELDRRYADPDGAVPWNELSSEGA